MLKKKCNCKFLDDTQFEGREKLSLDVDRMINEGLAGGTVVSYKNCTNIHETTSVSDENDNN